MTRATILLRLSVESDASDSIDRQRDAVTNLASSLGATIVAEHADSGVSGGRESRPSFEAWLADLESGRADLAMAYDLSRISRRGLTDMARLVDVLDRTGARLLTVRDSLDSESPAFRLVVGVLSEVARAERLATRDRVMSRQAADRARGVFTRTAPVGYVKRDGKLVRDPDSWRTVRKAFDLYLGGGSMGEVTEFLNDSPVSPQRAERWTVSSVSYLLKNPLMAGVLHHNGSLVRTADGAAVVVCDKPIISLSEHLEAVSRAGANAAPRGPRTAARYPLSGLTRCSLCGSPMVFNRRRGRANRVTCAHRNAGVECVGLSVNADDLLGHVRGVVLARLAAEPVESLWLGDVAHRLGLVDEVAALHPTERTAVEHDLADVTTRLAEMEDAYFSGTAFTGAEGRRRYTALHETLTAQRSTLEQRLGAASATNLTPLIDPDLWTDSDDEALRGLLLAAVSSVSVGREEVKVCWRE